MKRGQGEAGRVVGDIWAAGRQHPCPVILSIWDEFVLCWLGRTSWVTLEKLGGDDSKRGGEGRQESPSGGSC